MLFSNLVGFSTCGGECIFLSGIHSHTCGVNFKGFSPRRPLGLGFSKQGRVDAEKRLRIACSLETLSGSPHEEVNACSDEGYINIRLV